MLGRHDATEVGSIDDVETDDVVTFEDEKSWPPAMEVKDAGFETGEAVEVKDASADIAVTVEETDDPFVFELVGGVTGLVDRVNDVVMPGAYAKTLKARTPKIIKDHEWSQRLGKVLSIKELLPGDPELPKTVASGEAWPKEAGALVAKVKLFKKSQAGQEAAERWREYGRDQQFSIGYRVPSGMAVKSANGVRKIKELDLYEISDVLWGAAPDSTLLPSSMSMKILQGDLETKDVEEPEELDEDTNPVGDPDNPEAALAQDTVDGNAEEDDDIIGDVDPDDIEDVDMDDDEIDAAAFDAFGDEIAMGMTSDIERGEEPENRAPSTSDAGEHTADTLHDPAPGNTDAPDNAAASVSVVTGTDGPMGGEPENAAPSTSDAGMAGRPEFDSNNDSDRSPEAKINTSPMGSAANGENWIEAAKGNLPAYVRGLARGMMRNGHSQSQAIALAIGAIKRWASGKGNVKADTRAKAVKALAQWEALKAKNAARKATKADDVEIEVEELSGTADRKSLTVPFFAGSNEELRALVNDALAVSVKSGELEGDTRTLGVFDSYAIVNIADSDTSYKVDFDYDPAEGTVELSTVLAVKVNAVDADVEHGELKSAFDDMSDGPVEAVKHTVAMLDLEDKAGRVLSAANAEALKSAYEALGSLLSRAGVDVATSDDETDGGGGDVVTDETDVAAKDDHDDDAETKMLELMRIEAEVRARALAFND